MRNASTCASGPMTAATTSPILARESADLSLRLCATLDQLRDRCAVSDRTVDILPVVGSAPADPALSDPR
jgi:hypothetical protein